MPTINIVLQGKGGVGKSLIATLLSMYYQNSSISYQSYDTDPVNATLYAYKGLNVEPMPVMTGDAIDPRKFDSLINNIIEKNENTIIDVGSNSFVPFSSYLLGNEIFSFLKSYNYDPIVHTVISGGANLGETTMGLKAIITQFPTDIVKFAVWLNPFFGDIVTEDNKAFTEFKTYKELKEHINGLILLPKLKKDLHEVDFQTMLTNGLTFEESQTSELFNLIEKHRLNVIKNKIYEAISVINPLILNGKD